jgi:hypothetical protein
MTFAVDIALLDFCIMLLNRMFVNPKMYEVQLPCGLRRRSTVCLCEIKKPQERGGEGPHWVV